MGEGVQGYRDARARPRLVPGLEPHGQGDNWETGEGHESARLGEERQRANKQKKLLKI